MRLPLSLLLLVLCVAAPARVRPADWAELQWWGGPAPTATWTAAPDPVRTWETRVEVSVANRSAERIQGAWLIVYARPGWHIRAEGPVVDYRWAYDARGNVDWARSEARRVEGNVIYYIGTFSVSVGLGDLAPGESVVVTVWGSHCIDRATPLPTTS